MLPTYCGQDTASCQAGLTAKRPFLYGVEGWRAQRGLAMGASAAVSRSPAPASTHAAPLRAEQSSRLRAAPWPLCALLGGASVVWPLLGLPAAGLCLLG